MYFIYLKTKINVPDDKKVWAIIGNTDAFKLWINEEECIAREEIRYYTPYNNAVLINLKKGTNIVTLKLLRRTEKITFSIGFRNYENCHWHWSKWSTDIK